MRVYASSLVPTNPLPYLHLGYSSAMTTETAHGGSIAFSIFMGSITTCLLLCIIGKSRKYVLLGLAILVVGSSSTVLIASRKAPLHYVNPKAATINHIFDIVRTLTERKYHGEPISLNSKEMQRTWGVKPNTFEDGWRHPLKLQKGVKPHESYLISSAGPDGTFNTPDDIVEVITDEELALDAEGLAEYDKLTKQQHK